MTRIQYTIRSIPPLLDQALRKRAQQTGKSFNRTVVEALSLQVFHTATPPVEADNFDWLFGADTLDNAFDKAVCDQSKIDDALWK